MLQKLGNFIHYPQRFGIFVAFSFVFRLSFVLLRWKKNYSFFSSLLVDKCLLNFICWMRLDSRFLIDVLDIIDTVASILSQHNYLQLFIWSTCDLCAVARMRLQPFKLNFYFEMEEKMMKGFFLPLAKQMISLKMLEFNRFWNFCFSIGFHIYASQSETNKVTQIQVRNRNVLCFLLNFMSFY